MTSSIRLRMREISAAWISRSDTWPYTPWVAGWWIRMRAFSTAMRRPGVPAHSSTAAADAACPRQTVWMSGRMNCIVS